jgi:hypothetical protein
MKYNVELGNTADQNLDIKPLSKKDLSREEYLHFTGAETVS